MAFFLMKNRMLTLKTYKYFKEMKRILVLITLIFAVNITLFSQEKTGAKISGGSYAQISFNEVEHDYGTIKKTATAYANLYTKTRAKLRWLSPTCVPRADVRCLRGAVSR